MYDRQAVSTLPLNEIIPYTFLPDYYDSPRPQKMPETKPTMATETPDEEFFVDPFRPRDPNIPFFWRPGVYTKYLSTRPRLDVDRFAELKFARLVQPGIHSVEVYEAIIRKPLGYHRTLKVFVTQAGIVQTIRLYGARARAYIPQDKRLNVQD